MPRRRRYMDRRFLGPSRRVPFIPGEPGSERHKRRYEVALNSENELRVWCNSNGWELELKNDGEHWLLRRPGHLVQWWPRTAKLVVDEQWKKSIHVLDIDQVVRILNEVVREDGKP